MKNIKKFLKKTISIICIICILIPNIAYGATEAEFQNAIASYCYNFYKNSGAYTRYDYGTGGLGVNAGHSNNYAREQAYLGNMLSGEGHSSKGNSTGVVTAPDKAYFFDCVGWVSFAVHNSVRLGNDTFTYFAVPTGCGGATGNGYANLTTTTDLRPGDILRSSGHVMLYVGDVDNSGKGSIIHCTGYGKEGGPANGSSWPNYNWGLICEYYDTSSWKQQVVSVARVTSSALAGLDASTFNSNGTTLSVATGNGGISEVNMVDFYYNGIPDGKYSVTKGFFVRIIDALKDIFNFLIGLIPNIIKMVFVGWAAIFESLITTAVKTATGDENLETIPVTSTDIESGDNITIEKIVFNKMSIFDVNFFNFN